MLAEIAIEIHPYTNAPLLPRLLQILKCSSCGKNHFEIHRDESTPLNKQTHCVIVCEECKTCFKYDNGILDMLVEKPYGLSMAQKSNFMSMFVNHYQTGWRSWCMTVFCGQNFTNAMEIEKITQMMEFGTLPENPILLDVGTGHGFYAIALAKKLIAENSAGFVIAIDFSKKMLCQAVAAAERSSVGEKIIWILADVEDCPVADTSVDRVTCGGSLNEYRHPEKAVQESARILKKEGNYLTMNLFRKNALISFLLLILHWASGLLFFSKEYWNYLFTRSGFQILRQETIGMAMFTISKK